MQGYIIDIKSVRDDDLIVTILTDDSIYTTYRFYGGRHSTVNVGYKIDFELESNLKSTMPRLKDVLQISFNWIFVKEKLYCWQRFLKLFYPHLKDVEDIDDFYFNLLEELAHKLIKQDAKRAICETYIKLLEHEGRLHSEYICLLCEQKIENEISLVRSFHPVHPNCTYSKQVEYYKIDELFKEKSLIFLDDEEVEYIWQILLQGI